MAKKKEEKTNVMRILDQRKIPYTARFYEDSQGPEGTREYGVHVAEALGQDPHHIGLFLFFLRHCKHLSSRRAPGSTASTWRRLWGRTQPEASRPW